MILHGRFMAAFKLDVGESHRIVFHTAILLTVLVTPSFSQERIEVYENCPQYWSGIRIVNPSGDEIFRACQQGWAAPDQTKFVHLTRSEAPDLFYATIAGAKVQIVTVYRRGGHVFKCVGEFAGFSVQPTLWNGRPAIQYEQLTPQGDRPEHFVYFVWSERGFSPNENLDSSSYHACSDAVRQER